MQVLHAKAGEGCEHLAAVKAARSVENEVPTAAE